MTPTADQLAEQVLVMDAQAGSVESMGRLIERRQGRLYRHALRLTGDRDLAWDVLQEACLAMVRGLGQLHDPAAFRAWSYRLVTNKAADAIRRRQRRRALTSRAARDSVIPPQPAVRDDTVHAALSRLSVDRRSILELHYLDDLSIAEIATAMDIPPGTVKSRLHAAREELRIALQWRGKE